MQGLTSRVGPVCPTVVTNAESLAIVVATAGALEETREVQTIARRLAMLALRVHVESASSHAIVVSIGVASFVPSSSPMVVCPAIAKTCGHVSCRAVVNALQVGLTEMAAGPMATSVHAVGPYRPLVNGVGRSGLVETRTCVLVSNGPTKATSLARLRLVETKDEVSQEVVGP